MNKSVGGFAICKELGFCPYNLKICKSGVFMPDPKYVPEEPICAVATALAPAALGIVRCTGKGCVSLLSKVFSRPAALLQAAGNSIVYGWIKNGGAKIDEVMVSVFRAPKSFTGEDMVEVSCHGGPGVVMAVQNVLLNNGFRQAKRGEFTFRAFINGKADLTKAEAVQEIIESRTGESRSRAVGRLAGNLFEEISGIKKLLTDTLASIEVEIEYPEDEETIADSFDRSDLQEAIRRLSELNDSWQGEKLYQDGARVVLCGRTNAGKSSLFNAILKEDRAIVSDIEGTTRDWLESWVDFGGLPVRLFDTAGLRETEDVIEAHGVELTKNLTEDADVILYLCDGASGLSKDDIDFLRNAEKPVVFCWNKIDATDAALAEKNSLALKNENIEKIKKEIKISAKKGNGFSELYGAVKEILFSGTGNERAQAGLGSARQKLAVEEALESVSHSIVAADKDFALDAVVQDLEDAIDFLGEVTGEVTADDVLESIFSRFCVGK